MGDEGGNVLNMVFVALELHFSEEHGQALERRMLELVKLEAVTPLAKHLF